MSYMHKYYNHNIIISGGEMCTCVDLDSESKLMVQQVQARLAILEKVVIPQTQWNL